MLRPSFNQCNFDPSKTKKNVCVTGTTYISLSLIYDLEDRVRKITTNVHRQSIHFFFRFTFILFKIINSF
jgi:hypothetical protein